MNILKTARVVVVDDVESEATPLLLSLAKIGIGTWYFTGKVDELPKSPLDGIRVVFLDLRLSGADSSSDPKHKFSHALSVLDNIVGTSKNTVGIVYWTKNEEDIETFEAQLHTDLPDFSPTFLHRIENKSDLLKRAGENSMLEIVKDSIRTSAGTELLLNWEQAVHDAASATSNRLAEFAESDEGDNDACQMKILAALATSNGADSDVTESLNVVRLFESLNPIHSDHLEQLTLRKSGIDNGASAAALKEEVEKRNPLPSKTMSHINGIVLTSRTTNDDPDFQPGAAYTPRTDLGVKCPHHHAKIPMADLAKDILKYTKDPTFEKANKLAGSKKLDPEKTANGEKDAIARMNEINSECKRLLVEISPACDFAQGKRSTVRFVGGLLVPEKYFELIKSSHDYLKPFEPVTIQEFDGVWQFIFNSRYIFGVAEAKEKIESHPKFRLRNPPLIDLIAWAASQMARPGYVSLRS